MKKFFCIIGIMAGIWMFVSGVFLAGNEWLYHDNPEEMKFGADYYTDQYSVTRDIAINTNRMGARIGYMSQYLGFTICGLGIVIACYFGIKLFEKNIQGQTQYLGADAGKNDELPDL